MIGMRTILEVADNNGARRLQCYCHRAARLGLQAGLGDIITASVEARGFGDQEEQGRALRGSQDA
jgi:large subunit ribosomal protein L14